MIEEKVLQDLGLTEIEAKVYLACLELVSDTVLKIAKKAEVKRPTCYVALDNLFEKGLVTKIKKKNTTLFSAEKPTIILNKFQEKIANFKDLLPFFEAKFNKGPKPKIRYYEGINQLFSVYANIIFPSQEICFFGTDVKKINQVLPNLFTYWEKHHMAQFKNTKEIVSYNLEGLKYVKKYGKKWPIKIMPKNLPVFANSVIIENKIFIVSLDNQFGVLIESEDLAKTYKNFFLLAWQAAIKKA